MKHKIIILQLILLLGFSVVAWAGDVDSNRACNAARNWITQVVHAYGSWGGASNPSISGAETLVFNGVVVGYNFTVSPKGHVIVSARDDIPAVKLYSDTSTLSLLQADMQEQIDWIAEEIFQVGDAIDTHGFELSPINHSQNPDRNLWVSLDKAHQDFALSVGQDTNQAVSYGPLLASTWNQPNPYNQECPLSSSGCRTIVGCVATAASQIMKYWKYPSAGQGSKSYTWYNGSSMVTLSRNFADSTYDWANMPNVLTGDSTAAQKSAVSKLCADVGIAFEMFYGCGSSGAYTSDAPDVFKTYFKYKSSAKWVNRGSYASASDWMKVFKTETQAGRPSQLRINDPDKGGHSVVVDGYRDSPSETVHINMGWQGSYDGWYTPDSFSTGGYKWINTSYQGAAIGIEPPTISASAQVTSLWPVADTQAATSGILWALVKNTGAAALPSDAKVWYYVTGPGWTTNWVGSTSASGLAAGASQWFSFGWPIPLTAAVGTYTYWARLYQGSTPISDWSGFQSFAVLGSSTLKALMTSPVNGSTLTSTTQTFVWTHVGASQYWLYLGSSPGKYDICNKNAGASTSLMVSGLPSDGGMVYATLWTLSGSTWLYNQFSYKADTATSGFNCGSDSFCP